MSVEKLSRDRGTITRCGNGGFDGRPACSASYFTGLTRVPSHHASAVTYGWGKSKAKGFGRVWLCPEHKSGETATLAAEKAARKLAREQERARKKQETAERKQREKEQRQKRKAAS